MIFAHMDPRRFDALAGYARHPRISSITQEIAWYSSKDSRVLGIVLLDLIDHDYSWVVFGRDELKRFRAIKVNASLSTCEEARAEMFAEMARAVRSDDASFHQGDTEGEPVDFFDEVIDVAKVNPTFRVLAGEERYSPAREIVQAMMRYHQDVDGNFVQNFQTAGFDARLWELYLWATFTELGYVRKGEVQVPDFIFEGIEGGLAIEATTANPPDRGDTPNPRDKDEIREYLENYIPIKLSGVLRKKLNRTPPYWDGQAASGLPFCLAVQDFAIGGSMRFIAPAALEYLFGVRHWMENDERKISRIKVHRFGKMKAQSGFFQLPKSEHVSAVIINPQGTLLKFNRMGFLSGFGSRAVKMTRTGVLRNDGDLSSPGPKKFQQFVDGYYHESWVEGMVVVHNPNALIPLDPNLIVGAAHEFLQDDGSIQTLLPEFHPLFSQTQIELERDLSTER